MTSRVESTLARPLAERVGQLVADRYRIHALLGTGGAGAVYEAEHVATGGRVAIKTLLPDHPDAALLAERFRREAQAASLLGHPNIVAIHELLDEGDDLYLVMELLRGRSVGEVLEGGALGVRRALVIARQAIEGLAHAHARGMIHRDIKPANLMLVTAGEPGREFERVKLLDFGLIKLVDDGATVTQTGMVFGTPAYVSPEQAQGHEVDARADLYALGVVLFEMLTGRPPFRSPDPGSLVRMHVSAPVPTLAAATAGRSWCTPALEQLVARALAKQAADRFGDAAAMRAALDEAFVSLDHLPAQI